MKALTTVTRIHPQAGTFQAYMQKFVTPVLFRGLQELAFRRPDKPAEFLAYYLMEKNPVLNDKANQRNGQGKSNKQGGGEQGNSLSKTEGSALN